MQGLWVQALDGDQGWSLTDKVEGLSYSNVNPGGDEVANFVYKRSWRASLPEIARGNLLRIGSGLDVLWQGRVEEHARGGEALEEIAVTAYGLGRRLKDTQMAAVYIDQDLGNWQEMSRARRIVLETIAFNPLGFSTEPDSASGLPSLKMDGSGRWPNACDAEAIYDAGDDCLLGYVTYSWSAENHASGGLTAATWQGILSGASDDALSGTVTGTDVLTGGTSGSQTETAPSGKRVALLQLIYVGASASDATRSWTLTAVKVYGDHGLATGSNGGLTADQIIAHAVAQANGITARRVDPQSYEILQAEYREALEIEEIVSDVNRYEDNDWGTWGPDSPLDNSTNGQFDYTSLDLTTEHWLGLRSDFDSLDLSTEIDGLFDTVKVRFTDPAGVSRVTTRTATVPELVDAGMSPKTLAIDGGTLTAAAAQTLGDAFLVLTGGFAPARGSASISSPLKHHTRGMLPPCYLRADGSNLRIPDVLPTTAIFDASSAPDRRTTFPIKRVTVDASGPTATATLDLDQASDLLSALTARLGVAAEIAT